MTWVHLVILELSVAAVALLVAKLDRFVLSLDWHWYAAVGGLAFVCLVGFVLRPLPNSVK